MNVVSENHADSFACAMPFGMAFGHSQDGLIAAVIGEGLRDNLADAHDDVPEMLLALVRTLEDRGTAR